ncbi:MAG: cation-transporting P-type ATPase, partial [Alphaproteobacteria bacterium]|nr:cation-transporting P-type ATPase [Alphaproteobacteria bacterium]
MSKKPEAGLTSREARRRLAAAGSEGADFNRQSSIVRILREVFSEPIFLLMLAAGGLYFVMGSAVDGAILMGFVLIIMVMTIVQERRTERVLELL